MGVDNSEVAMAPNLKSQLMKIAATLIAKTGLSQRLMGSRDAISRRTVYLAGSGKSLPLPDDVQFEITMRCNLNCVMCHQKERRKQNKAETDFEGIKSIIDNFATEHTKRVKLVGGEVFLREDLVDIISYLEEKRIGVSITTNGSLIDDTILAELKKRRNILGMVFSIDGLEEVHNRIRRSRNGFSRTIANLRKASSFLPLTKITCVIQKDNLTDIEELICKCKDWGVDVIAYMAESFFSERDLSRTQMMLSGLGDIKFFVTAAENPANEYTLEEFLIALERVKSVGRRKAVIAYVSPQSAALHPKEFYGGEILRSETNSLSCGYLDRLTITESGDVLSCPFIDLSFGSLLYQKIDEIWNSDKYKEYRSLFVSKGPFPICRRCCLLAQVK